MCKVSSMLGHSCTQVLDWSLLPLTLPAPPRPARRHNVSLLAYSPLGGGSLSGKYITGNAKDNSRFNLFQGYMARYMESSARIATQEYMDIAKKYGMTPTELALAWCRSRWVGEEGGAAEGTRG
jgi:aryl-alcohol dehydrogenase-like predicted oxidoreductase